ncbi:MULTISPECIES: type I-C CRISPR-associated protein Cas5c [unclassified Methylobacterium]|uniref:type I-C CRISPR-associated protein Cas5c n=1 Tax=unclassified Methylobacterium TaxID=2615210 RepID=UPI002269D759|nr:MULTISPECIES: type I-C CRISPR-associated protein Cas5c [unclassified Methylobacterium]
MSRNHIRLRVEGEFACFTRPEFKAERRSYDVMNPSAAQGLLESIYWKPQMRYEILRIHVLKPIRFISMTLNELGQTASRNGQNIIDDRIQKTTSILADVAYVIEARIDEFEDQGKHGAVFERRASQGQYFRPPVLGQREFVCRFKLLGRDETFRPIPVTRNLGWMFHQRLFDASGRAERMTFFDAKLVNGTLEIPPFLETRHAA